jgi:hypothetical protein
LVAIAYESNPSSLMASFDRACDFFVVTQLSIFDRICGPEPPTPADLKCEADHERLARAFPVSRWSGRTGKMPCRAKKTASAFPQFGSVPGDRTDELWAAILDSESADNSATVFGTYYYDLPSITDRNELIARHGDPEVGAIPLLKRKSICFLAAPAALDRSWRRVADARSR